MSSDSLTTHVDDEIPPFVASVTQQGINLFHESFGGSNPIHTDAALAAQSEFGAPIQHGIRTLFPAFAMLAQRFGSSFLEGGGLKVKFVAAVVDGDVITTRISRAPSVGNADAGGATLNIRCENARGDTVLIGTARLSGRQHEA